MIRAQPGDVVELELLLAGDVFAHPLSGERRRVLDESRWRVEAWEATTKVRLIASKVHASALEHVAEMARAVRSHDRPGNGQAIGEALDWLYTALDMLEADS